MIVNERIYTLCAGKVPEYLQLFAAIRNQEHGDSDKDTGQHAGYFHTEFGTLNQIVHL